MNKKEPSTIGNILLYGGSVCLIGAAVVVLFIYCDSSGPGAIGPSDTLIEADYEGSPTAHSKSQVDLREESIYRAPHKKTTQSLLITGESPPSWPSNSLDEGNEREKASAKSKLTQPKQTSPAEVRAVIEPLPEDIPESQTGEPENEGALLQANSKNSRRWMAELSSEESQLIKKAFEKPVPDHAEKEILNQQRLQAIIVATEVVDECFEELLQREPDASGRLIVAFEIQVNEGSGSFNLPQITTNHRLHDAAFEGCILQEIVATVFEAPGKGTQWIEYPFFLDN